MNMFSYIVRAAELAMSASPATTSAVVSAGSRRLRIAVVQFNPILHDVAGNRRTVDRLTRPLDPSMIDILLLPEMCLTGYTFPSPQAIVPYLETSGDGPTSELCKGLASRLSCVVMAGYPERVNPETEIPEDEKGKVGWNSAMVYSPQGELLHNYRKHNLFLMDLPWALPGPSFSLVPSLPGFPNLRIALAICNDLNPPTTLDEWCVSNDVDLLFVLCAWLSSDMVEDAPDGHGTTEDDDILEESEQKEGGGNEVSKDEWEFYTVSYWLTRLGHILVSPPSPMKPRYAVICNRTGTELGNTFAGSSLMWKIGAVGKIEIIGRLGRAVEGVGLWSIDVDD